MTPEDDGRHGYYSAIKDEMTNHSKNGQSVLIFFETKNDLELFYNWDRIEEIKSQIKCITEDLHSDDKDLLIKNSTQSGHISLLTRVFGRGVDFVCTDEKVKAAGGVHVL